jgi:hemerythrin-like domain-containing protein
MPVQIGSKPESGPDDPIGWLSDCHRRIERFLGVLVTVAEQAGSGTMTEIQRTAFENALRYFRDAAPKHTADEEESLFPRLRQIKSESLEEALDLVTRLEQDHRAAEAMHAEVDRLGKQWLRGDQWGEDQSARLVALLKELSQIYAAHIDIEDNQVFPAAKKLLPDSERIAAGREMAARRERRA